jgi:hypothetical protein
LRKRLPFRTKIKQISVCMNFVQALSNIASFFRDADPL